MAIVSDLAATHFLVLGRTRSGKSKFFESIAPQLVERGWGFAAIDRKGTTAEGLARSMDHRNAQKVIYLDCTRDDWVIPINMFVGADVDRSIEATLKAFGMENANETPLISKWLNPIYDLFSS